jgi:hypothetical protein
VVAAAGMRLVTIRELALATWALPEWPQHRRRHG